MNSVFEKTITKKVTLTEESYLESLKLASQIGLRFQDYLRYLITQDIKLSYLPSKYSLPESKAKAMLNAINQIHKGKFRKINDLEKIIQDLRR